MPVRIADAGHEHQASLTNFAMATPCDGKNWNGWTCDLDLEAKRVAFAQASTPAERKAAVEAIQHRYYEVMPFLNVGQLLWPKVVHKEIMRDDAALNDWIVRRTPAGRWGDSVELQGAVAFLASDAERRVAWLCSLR